MGALSGSPTAVSCAARRRYPSRCWKPGSPMAWSRCGPRAELAVRRLDRHLPDHLPRVLVVAESLEAWVSKLAVLRPLRELHLANQLRLYEERVLRWLADVQR